jgi:hypothetical protein
MKNEECHSPEGLCAWRITRTLHLIFRSRREFGLQSFDPSAKMLGVVGFNHLSQAQPAFLHTARLSNKSGN